MSIYKIIFLLYNMSRSKKEGECMKNEFNVEFTAINEKEFTKFGVFSSTVKVPDYYVCQKGDKAFLRLFYVVQGSIVFNENTEHSLTAKAGDIVFLPSDIEYVSRWDNRQDGKYISINFMSNIPYISFPETICIATSDKYGMYLEMFENVYSIWTKGAIGYKFETLASIYKIIYQLFLDSTYKKLKRKENVIYKGIIYLENHYIEDVTVGELAEMCNISESSFRRYFKRYKNMSPITYRNYLRMKKAKEIIQSGEYTLYEVAIEVGIPDICYFQRLFKNTFGVSPGSIKKDKE